MKDRGKPGALGKLLGFRIEPGMLFVINRDKEDSVKYKKHRKCDEAWLTVAKGTNKFLLRVWFDKHALIPDSSVSFGASIIQTFDLALLEYIQAVYNTESDFFVRDLFLFFSSPKESGYKCIWQKPSVKITHTLQELFEKLGYKFEIVESKK